MKKKKKQSVFPLILFTGIIIALIVIVLTSFLNGGNNPDDYSVNNKGYFTNKHYIKASPTGNLEGPSTAYYFFNNNGTFETFGFSLANPNGSVGTYKIEGNKIILKYEYGYITCFKNDKASLVGYTSDYTYTLDFENNKIVGKNSEYSEIDVKDYKEAAKDFGYSYKEVKNIYKKNPGSYPNICK